MLASLAPKLPGIEIIPMYFDPDGRFPYHDANPSKDENLTQLQARVQAEGADFGAAFDGDGDRCGLVDGAGRIVSSDLVSALLAQALLKKTPGATIAYDLRSSKVVAEKITEWGGTPVETRVGHSFIKATMKETGAIFAGELSGHYYFKEFFGADGGLFAFILLANLISANSSLTDLVTPLRKYHHTGEINFKVKDTQAVFAALKALPDVTVTELDGVTVRADGWWCNVRASNTEPVVRLNLEADTAEAKAAELTKITALIEGAGSGGVERNIGKTIGRRTGRRIDPRHHHRPIGGLTATVASVVWRRDYLNFVVNKFMPVCTAKLLLPGKTSMACRKTPRLCCKKHFRQLFRKKSVGKNHVMALSNHCLN